MNLHHGALWTRRLYTGWVKIETCRELIALVLRAGIMATLVRRYVPIPAECLWYNGRFLYNMKLFSRPAAWKCVPGYKF